MRSWQAKIVRRSLFSGSVVAAVCLALITGAQAEEWVELKNCRLLQNMANDADSFHVQTGGKEYIFRLYFVDGPETDTSVAGRVEEQARYFGLTVAQTVQLGELGRRFTREKLGRGFSVRTCMQDARGRSELPRFFAFVETAEGDLAELLVANGLARLYGAAATPVGLKAPERGWEKLRQLEQRAKAEKVGAWGVSTGRMATRSATPLVKSANSFDEFFHADRTAAVPVDSSTTASPSKAAAPDKLDVNTASSEQLLALPGVGQVLVGRIITARPFKSADDLRRVEGIGEKRYEQLRPLFLDR